ncbi:MAG: SDR family oxidoreductase [Deltaproteobacteria bacterium]|nr:SDR family oxidoreductase [Deltaproteobacteria bacterium]
MMKDRRVAVVMGAGGGIASAIGRALAKSNIKVVGVDIDENRLERFREIAGSYTYKPMIITGDITRKNEVERIKDEVEKEFGRVDILVNSQGALQNELLRKLTEEGWRKTLSVHLEGTLNSMLTFSPLMLEAKYGRIVNMSSIAVQGSIAGASYGAAKGAIEGLSRTAALEWAKYGITVNCVAPGLINAGLFLTTPEHFQKIGIEHVPMKRAGEPEEVAYCVRFLCSEEASFITGQTIYVCGGMSFYHGI